jgi:hypothetical protein
MCDMLSVILRMTCSEIGRTSADTACLANDATWLITGETLVGPYSAILGRQDW